MQDRNEYQQTQNLDAARAAAWAAANAAAKWRNEGGEDHAWGRLRQHYTPEAPQRGPRRIARGRDWLKVAFIVACVGLGGALTAPKAHAWTTHDAWTGHDKRPHLQAGALIAAPVSALADSWTVGALAGCAVGWAEEARDQYRGAGHTASLQDAAVTCLGAALGASVGVMVLPTARGVWIGKGWSF